MWKKRNVLRELLVALLADAEQLLPLPPNILLLVWLLLAPLPTGVMAGVLAGCVPILPPLLLLGAAAGAAEPGRAAAAAGGASLPAAAA